MENILSTVEGPAVTQVTSLEQIDQQTLQDFLAKTSVWHFYEITRDEYMNKSNEQKKDLIISFFNQMCKGKILLFVSLLFGVWLLLDEFLFA